MVDKGKEVDKRFSQLASDPRFLRPAKRKTKVVVDDRFKGLFEAEKTEGPRVDKYGRKVGKDKSREELKRFYHWKDDKGEGSSTSAPVDYARGQTLMESSSEEEDEESSDSESELDEEVALGARQRRASSEFSIDLDEEQIPLLEPEGDAATLAKEDETRRLAAVNLDWDHVRAIDLYKVFSSVLAPEAPDASRLPPLSLDPDAPKKRQGPRIARGRVMSVHIYPSEFGKARMEKENREGPPAEIFKALEEDDKSGDELEIDERAVIKEDDGAEYDERALRKYQLERLRYYYAIAEFDTKAAARHVLDEIDGTEFERSANTFELRMVPDGMAFEDEAKDLATSDAVNYKGLDFVTDALRHSRVKLTWDADDPQRSKLTRRDMSKLNETELENIDVTQYLASDTSDEEGADPETNKREALRRALGLHGDAGTKTKKGRKAAGDMEITFAPAFSEAKDDMTADETTLDSARRKEKERKARKKASQQAKAEAVAEVHPSESESAEEDFDGFADDQETPEAVDAGGFDDPFFASDSDDEAAAIAAHDRPSTNGKSAKKIKVKARTSKQGETEESKRRQAELSLLVDSDSDEGVEGKHFDMKAILKQEKEGRKGKKKRRGPKSAKDAGEAKDTFEVDVRDDRFRALHDDHRFAVDPTNPHYLKTRNTDKLLEESRRRRDAKDTKLPYTAPHKSNDGSLSTLVSAVKRKAESREAGKGKRHRSS